MDPRCIGGRIGMVGGLQTWTRDLRSHPHVHDIVAGGGLSAEGAWLPSAKTSWSTSSPCRCSSARSSERHLQRLICVPLVAARVWNKDWVVHCEPVGSGEAACRYLAPYHLSRGHQPPPYPHAGRWPRHLAVQGISHGSGHTATVPAEECIRRFFSTGCRTDASTCAMTASCSPGNRQVLHQGQHCLGARTVPTTTPGHQPDGTAAPQARDAPRCPTCGTS